MPEKILGLPTTYWPFVLFSIAALVFGVLVVIQDLRKIWENDQVLPRAVTGEFHAPKKFFDFVPFCLISVLMAIICGIALL